MPPKKEENKADQSKDKNDKKKPEVKKRFDRFQEKITIGITDKPDKCSPVISTDCKMECPPPTSCPQPSSSCPPTPSCETPISFPPNPENCANTPTDESLNPKNLDFKNLEKL